MGTRLYVGNLSFFTSQASVEALFATVGEVRDVSLPTDKETGMPRGFAFVVMGSEREAALAIARLNGATLDRRNIKVNEAQERPPGGGPPNGRGGR